MKFPFKPVCIYRKDTSNYTEKEIREEVEEITRIFKTFGIRVNPIREIKIIQNAEMGLKLGTTTRKYGEYFLKFNGLYFKVGTPENVHSTIIHEVIHCIPDGFNHGPRFKWYGQLIKTNFGIEIKTHSRDLNYMKSLEQYMKQPVQYTQTEKPTVQNNQGKYKYMIYCPTCKIPIGYKQRNCKLIREIKAGSKNYKCGLCGNNYLMIKGG